MRIFLRSAPYTGNSRKNRAGGWCEIAEKTVIYLDVLLLVNFLCAYFLLLAAGALSGVRAGFWRMAAGAALGALSALILFVPELPYPLQVAYKLISGGVVCAAAFGVKAVRRWLTASCWFAALNIALAGVAMLAILNSGTKILQTGNLTVYLRVSPLLLVGCAALCCLAVELGLRLLGAAKPAPPTVGLELTLCGSVLHLRAQLDTGCHLKDPITCLPVLLVSYPDAKARLPAPLQEYLDDWFAGRRRQSLPQGATLRLVPCQTATGNSLLPGFSVGGISQISGSGPQILGRSTVAFTQQSFGNTARYEALYGSDFL